MKDEILGIDHLMVSVHDSQRTGETFKRMGFTLTPRSRLPGMSNRLICFNPPRPDLCNFVEFLGFDDRAAAPPMMHDILGEKEGPVSMIMVAPDVRALAEAIAARGFEPAPVQELKRDWVLPDGEVISPAFIVCTPRYGISPLNWNVVQYLTPEHYRRPEFTAHANSARRLRSVLAVAMDPAAIAEHYRSAWRKQVSGADGIHSVTPGAVPLDLMSPDRFASTFPGAPRPGAATDAANLVGFVIEVADLVTLRRCLDAGAVPYRPLEDNTFGAGAVRVAPEDAHGCVVVFAQAH